MLLRFLKPVTVAGIPVKRGDVVRHHGDPSRLILDGYAERVDAAAVTPTPAPGPKAAPAAKPPAKKAPAHAPTP